ncbi:hypothetical protein P8452_55169 [Trifolium repens]|jgi:hypothetical protein|nr:hypothetical protein P8452_55169 [Trifolium repens]
MTSNHSPNNLVTTNTTVGEGHVSVGTVEREEGGARGKHVFGGKEACVVEVEVCESGGDVESFEAPVCCGKRGEVDVGPSGLDILIQNDEVEGGVDGVLLEEGVGLYLLGSHSVRMWLMKVGVFLCVGRVISKPNLALPKPNLSLGVLKSYVFCLL